MDGWMDGCIGGWIGGWLDDELMGSRMDGLYIG